MAGVILPHDTFGTHLDSQGNTVDIELEKENLASGDILADVFKNLIDGHEVQSRFVRIPQIFIFLQYSVIFPWKTDTISNLNCSHEKGPHRLEDGGQYTQEGEVLQNVWSHCAGEKPVTKGS